MGPDGISPAIRIPVQIIQGGRPVRNDGAGGDNCRACRKGIVETVILPGVGHSPHPAQGRTNLGDLTPVHRPAKCPEAAISTRQCKIMHYNPDRNMQHCAGGTWPTLRASSPMAKDFIDFQTDPSCYKHWKLTVDGEVATLAMDVDENGGLFGAISSSSIPTISASTSNWPTPGAPALRASQREGGAAALGQGSRLLRRRQHSHARGLRTPHKVNFCKFTNETRNSMEDASNIRASVSSPSSTERRPAAATNWRWRPTTS